MFAKKTVAQAIAGLAKAVNDLDTVIQETGTRIAVRMGKITDLEADNASDLLESRNAAAISTKLKGILAPASED